MNYTNSDLTIVSSDESDEDEDEIRPDKKELERDMQSHFSVFLLNIDRGKTIGC